MLTFPPWCQMLCIPAPALPVIPESGSRLPESCDTYCTESRTCASSSPRTALPRQSRRFSGSSRTCFLRRKASCELCRVRVSWVHFFIHCIHNACSLEFSGEISVQPLRLHATIPIKGEAAVCRMRLDLFLQRTEGTFIPDCKMQILAAALLR